MTPGQVAEFEKAYGKEGAAALRRIDPAAERKEAEELLERLSRDEG
jgi:hypothetical protein